MRVLVTGSAGFIGYHLAEALLGEGAEVLGFDGFTEYYDVALKRARHARLARHPRFTAVEGRLETPEALARLALEFRPEVIVHLAAQAGVRYSLEAPRAYLESNVLGSFEVMEAARQAGVRHLLMASTSSVYGANTEMPFRETHAADTPLTIYAATKKANEAMGHAWAHLHHLPVTMFRFFTVYGPWGRPDMAYYKFARAITAGEPIDVYNHGDMMRDFTYVGDLVRAIRLLIDAVPPAPGPERPAPLPGDSLSHAAPFRVVNIGNSAPVRLGDFIAALEDALGQRAIRRDLPMQPGDVPATWADTALLQGLTGYAPKTDLVEGMAQFVAWFRDYHAV